MWAWWAACRAEQSRRLRVNWSAQGARERPRAASAASAVSWASLAWETTTASCEASEEAATLVLEVRVGRRPERTNDE